MYKQSGPLSQQELTVRNDSELSGIYNWGGVSHPHIWLAK